MFSLAWVCLLSLLPCNNIKDDFFGCCIFIIFIQSCIAWLYNIIIFIFAVAVVLGVVSLEVCDGMQ